MIDNISLLASSRTWVAPDTVLPEVSWNIGGSIMQEFKMFKQKSSLTIDFYHTEFENQMIVDRDVSSDLIVFGNLDGTSFSNSLQAELAVGVSKTIDLRFAYKYLDVRASYGGTLQQQAMIPIHRGFFNFGYKSRNKRWEFDFTTSVFGDARLPIVILPDSSFTTKNRSDIYPHLSAQITHNFKKWDIYLGGENLLNFTQKDPIIDAENPFSSTFNATRIWAPVYGINVYAGIRFAIKQKENED